MIKRATRFTLALAALAGAVPIPAIAGVAESGWRAASAEEKKLRDIFEKAQDDWNPKVDGEAEMYQCALRWASWGMVTRTTDDVIPTISGELTHSFADGQLSHYLTVLRQKSASADEYSGKFAQAAVTYANRPDESIDTIVRLLGKCYVNPASWSIAGDMHYTGPQIMEVLGDKPDPSAMPEHVRSRADRATYDKYIMDKDFVAAANFGAMLHGRDDKTTVMWNEVLANSNLAVAAGQGTQLSSPLLATLAKVWWPKYKRGWASTLLAVKNGTYSGSGVSGRPGAYTFNEKLLEEPAWAKQERERFLRGETNYTPCNQWNSYGC
jgi:hypothetical protein